jgi:hypothetical protein
MNTLRKLWESVIYMGMKPGSTPSQTRIARFFGPLRGPVERFLAGGMAPSDPLYLTNRTFGQKLRTGVVVAIPCLIVIALVTVGVGSYIKVREKPVRELTALELRDKILPDLAKTVHVTTNHDLEVTEAHVESGQTATVWGKVRNNTDHSIDNAEVVFDLTTRAGARLGAVAAKIPHVEAKSEAPFRVSVEQDTAAFALVREVVLR